MKTLFLEKNHLETVKNILRNYPWPIYAYGSRTKGTNKKFSDLDLCIKGKINFLEIETMKEEFKNSNLPFSVDVVSWERLEPYFQELIKKDMVLIKN